MEKKKFLEFRDKLVEILTSDKEAEQWADRLCVSALNEITAETGFCFQVRRTLAVFDAEYDKI